MKNIKYFMYKDTYEFERFLNEFGYKLNDAVGFSVSGIQHYHGNVLKEYIIYINDGESIYFNVVCFKSFNECQQARLGFKGERLLNWYNDAAIREYK